ncbi:RbsD/FucU domain-containing protein [Kineococcus sp. SYSU DK005]|uniref:RbsD/FucU domain-containing protein n=1 Tax=Kineococcus sp. SYSU DK005 TaxID=3383126 RepID=UPI003D7DC275
MLNYRLLHPPLLAALARAGHGDRIVLADANFPLRAAPPPVRGRAGVRPGREGTPRGSGD